MLPSRIMTQPVDPAGGRGHDNYVRNIESLSNGKSRSPRTTCASRKESLAPSPSEKFRVGTTNRLDVEQARTVLEQTRSTIPALQITLGQANDTLCTLLGMPPHELEPKLGPGPELGGSPIPARQAGSPRAFRRTLPFARTSASIERRSRPRAAQIGVAEAPAAAPPLAVNGIISWDAQKLLQVLRDQKGREPSSPASSWSILNYGRIKNNVRCRC